ncbi:hypothetical protein EGW08_009842 [Elysia chlorotica]|uniref:Dynein heavy chain tail domain-containing protein n=1 Tax=Elysia chlorotica TaxID=188477 RepID=A0A3S1BET6_ELYCH|nr:hypothetical protein EGW08_009842 [Elysia chlorotica]
MAAMSSSRNSATSISKRSLGNLSSATEHNNQMLAKEMREERRATVIKAHKYLFALAGHHLCLSNEEMEEFTLDDPTFLRILARFMTKEGRLIMFLYQWSKDLIFEDCGRSYATLQKTNNKVMRVLVTKGEGWPIMGKCVVLLKRNKIDLDDRNIMEEVTTCCFNVKPNGSLLGAIADLVCNAFQPALKNLKNWGSIKHTKIDETKCECNDLFVFIESFQLHLEWAEQHVADAVQLATLDTEKMALIDSITSVAGCLSVAHSKSTVAVFEEIGALWCQQIEMILTDAERIRREDDNTGPKKELEFWLATTSKFNYLVQQIRETRAKMVIHVLHIVKSPVMARWRALDMKVTDMANEARDNAKYLYTLEKYCEPLYRCQPLAMIDKLAGLIGTIRLIYNYSHYYYSTAKVSSILVKITSQIVTSCKSYISDNGESNLWLMPKDMLMTRLQNCIKLFQTYINLYQITKKKIAAKKNERPFDFSEMYIFGKIFTFRTRLEKIIMMLTIDKEFSPLEQCSVEGMDLHTARFATLMNNLRKKGFDLLNYRNLAFDEDYDRFLELVDDLKSQLQKFMNMTLIDLRHSLDRLDMMNRFNALNLSFLDIEEGYMNILNIYSLELDHMMSIYERDKEDPAIPWNLPPMAGRIYWVRHMLNHIAEPLFRLQKDRPSVMKTPEGKRVTYRYNKFAFVLAKTEVLYHVAWFKSLEATNDCLQVPILARHPITKEALINFDAYVFEVVKEAFYMVKLGLPVPKIIINIIHACTNITTTYRKLQMLLHEYDQLKDAIPEIFWPLMQPSIFKIDGLFYPAFTTITWTSLEIPAFFKELEKAFREMGLFIKTVCDVKYTRIDAKLNQIADTQMCSIPTTEPWTVDEFMQNTKEHALSVGEDLNKMNKMICDTVYELLRYFINNAFHEYKAIETIYATDQKIADHESKKTLNSSYVVAALNTLNETGEPDRTPLPEDLMTRESYVESCMALFEDLKLKIIDALIKGVRVSLSQLRKRFLSRWGGCTVLYLSL